MRCTTKTAHNLFYIKKLHIITQIIRKSIINFTFKYKYKIFVIEKQIKHILIIIISIYN